LTSPANQLLAALPPHDYARIAHEFETVEVRRRESMGSAGSDVAYVYFLESGAVAMLAHATGGVMLETALIGREGVVWLEPFFGATSAGCTALALLPGVARRVPVAAFHRVCQPGSSFYQLMRRYAGARLAAVAQSALCDATHSIRHRCVRRLLALHDAAASDHFPLTQQVLATLLGVRRASVSVAAEKLQEAGLIVYEHGRMHIADRPGLEGIGCGCYDQITSRARDVFSNAATA
jgi:CRP-like cAMP-binding protein